MARPAGPVAVVSNLALGIASSVLASLLKAESRERRKETDEIRRATRLSHSSHAGRGYRTYVLHSVPQLRTSARGPGGVVLASPAPREPQLDAAWPGFRT